jgi:flagellar hook protein FlgE
MGSFAIPLSGLLASQEDLGVISNNLANLNTTGFKGSSANFSNLIYQQLGSDGAGDPVQTGLGTQIGSTSVNFTEGSIQNTGVNSNVAIQGNGFLQVQNNGVTQYTRDGDLSLSSAGYLEESDGSQVMGYAAVNGVVSAAGATVPLQIQLGQTSPPQATANVGLTMNLDATAGVPASQQTGTGIAAGTVLATGSVITFNDATAGPFNFTYTTQAGDTLQTVVNQINASGNFTASLSGNSLVITANSGTPITFTANSLTDNATGTEAETFAASGQGAYSSPVTVYDSLGNSHVVTFNFDKTAANTWDYTVTIPGSDLTQVPAPANPAAPVTLSSGQLTFNPDGTLKAPGINVAGITLPAGDTMADGAKNLNFNWNLWQSATSATVTQVAGASTASTQQDGYAAGTLQSYTIQQDGTIQGSYSNGQVSALGQIALANFPNEEGLLQTGNGNYVATLASGLPSVGIPGTGGRGTLQGGALEGSNVDISTEFSNMILAQNSYEANARAFNTESTIFTNSTLQLGIGQ